MSKGISKGIPEVMSKYVYKGMSKGVFKGISKGGELGCLKIFKGSGLCGEGLGGCITARKALVQYARKRPETFLSDKILFYFSTSCPGGQIEQLPSPPSHKLPRSTSPSVRNFPLFEILPACPPGSCRLLSRSASALMLHCLLVQFTYTYTTNPRRLASLHAPG